MSDPIKPLLGEYVDQELSPPERARVESHLSACADCRGELADLKAVSSAVSGLAKQPLPTGFAQRLERRRKEAPQAPRTGWLPAPARLAAFAFSAAIAIMIVYDKLPTMFPFAGAAAGGDLMPPGSHVVPAEAAAPAALDAAKTGKDAFAPARKLARARGEPILALAAPAAPPAAAVQAKAAAEQASNEDLHAKLEAEKKKMGIKQILLPQDDVRHPMGQLAGMGSAASRGNVMQLAMSNGPAAVRGAVPQILQPAGLRGGSPAGAQGGAGASGVLLGNDGERLALWRRHGLTAAPPTVDYARQRLVVVIANDFTTAVEIEDVRALPDRVVVLYRLDDLPPDAARASAAPSYQFRVLPKSDLPVAFERLP